MNHELESQTKVLIVSLPGMMQHIVKETFAKRADVDLVGIAYGGLSAIKMIGHYIPDMIVINSNLPETEACELIEWLKQENPQIVSVVLGETAQQLSMATSAGANYALRSYSLPDQLNRLMGQLNKNIGPEI